MLKPILLLAIVTLALAGWLIYRGETAPEPMLHASAETKAQKPSLEIVP